MKASVVIPLLSLCATNVFASPDIRRRADDNSVKYEDLLEKIQELQLNALEEGVEGVKQRRTNSQCNINNVAIRRE